MRDKQPKITQKITSEFDFSDFEPEMSQIRGAPFVGIASLFQLFFDPHASGCHFRLQGPPGPQNDSKMTANSDPKPLKFNTNA